MNRPPFVKHDFQGKCKNFPATDRMLLPYQKKWVTDSSLKKICEKSRQIGLSWTTAYSVVRRKLSKSATLDAWIASRDEIQARLFLEDCSRFVDVFNAAASDQGQTVIDDAGNTAFTLRFSNGLKIHSMSSNVDAQSGKKGDRVLDEFALHSDPRRLYAIAHPGLVWGGQLEVFSTHRGTANYFNQLLLEARHKGNPKKFSVHRVTLRDALDQGFLYKLQCKLPPDDERMEMDESEYFDYIRAGAPDEETFLEEFMCTPSDDASAFLSYEALDGAKYRPGEKWEMSLDELRKCKDPLYLGGDIGRKKDLTVFWIVKAVADFRPTVHRVALRNTLFAEQERVLYQLLELPTLRRACIDNSGLGIQLVEDAQKRFGTYKVEPVNFTIVTKEELAYQLKRGFDDRTVRIPDDQKIIASHRAIRKETTLSGNIRFVAESTDAGHADDFWAHALALHAAKTPSTGAITPETMARIRFGGGTGPLLAPRRPAFTPMSLQRHGPAGLGDFFGKEGNLLP
jgi:phage FluMu gp28-like protein